MRLWTLSRASGAGVLAGLAALLLWPAYAAWPGALIPFALALGIAAFCGLSMLAFTLIDMVTQRRGARMRPLRIFDLVLGLVLSLWSLRTLHALFGQGDLHL